MALFQDRTSGAVGMGIAVAAFTAVSLYFSSGPADNLCREVIDKTTCQDLAVPAGLLSGLLVLTGAGAGSAIGYRMGRRAEEEHYSQHGMRYHR